MSLLRFFNLFPTAFLLCLALSCSKDESSYPVSLGDTEPFVCPEKEERGCWEFPDCRRFCEDVFIKEENEKDCYNWPMSPFEDFKDLKDSLNNKHDFPYIRLSVLECFFDLAEEEREGIFKNMTEKSSADFLEKIAQDKKLALLLAQKDKGDFSILKTILKKIKHRNITDSITGQLSTNDNFLILSHQHSNHAAWSWLDDYIIHKCQRDSRCDEPLDYYCKILKDVKSNPLKSFFKNQHFKRQYIKEIESKICNSSNCEYGDIQDFKDICKGL